MARVRRPTAGPGRPKKWPEELVDLFLRVPKSYKERFDAERGPMSRTEYFVFVMDHTHKDIKEMGRRIAELEQKVALLEKELEQKNKIIAQKDKIIERQNRTIEQLEKKLEDCASKLLDCKNNKPKLASKWSKILLAIPKAVEEGLTWNDLMRDLGILDPQEQVAVMQRFFITIDENGKIPEIIKPLPGIKELEGIVLYRENGVNVRFAKIVREDTLKAAKSLKVEAPKPTKEGQPAVKVPRAEIEKSLKAWLKQYEQWASNWRTKGQAESFLKSVGNNGLKRLVREYGFDVVAEVVGSNADYRALFGPFLLKLQEKKVEVKADV